MLSVFNLTPAAADPSGYKSERECMYAVQALCDRVTPDGLLRCRGMEEYLRALEPGSKLVIRDLIKGLQVRGNWVRFGDRAPPANGDWIKAYLNDHRKAPVTAILAAEAESATASSPTVVALHEMRDQPWWDREQAAECGAEQPRSVETFTRLLGPFLMYSSAIVVRDPYLDFSQPSPFRSFLKRACASYPEVAWTFALFPPKERVPKGRGFRERTNWLGTLSGASIEAIQLKREARDEAAAEINPHDRFWLSSVGHLSCGSTFTSGGGCINLLWYPRSAGDKLLGQVRDERNWEQHRTWTTGRLRT